MKKNIFILIVGIIICALIVLVYVFSLKTQQNQINLKKNILEHKKEFIPNIKLPTTPPPFN
ncbi:MAG: hypothetical protein AAB526_03760 [Patescibacteria group bacterium]